MILPVILFILDITLLMLVVQSIRLLIIAGPIAAGVSANLR
jgi:hypothetical protein